MKIIDSKYFRYLGSSDHHEYPIMEVDEDDAPLIIGDRIIKLHHFVNREHEDELITVRECQFILDDGRLVTFTSKKSFNDTSIDDVFDKFLGNPY